MIWSDYALMMTSREKLIFERKRIFQLLILKDKDPLQGVRIDTDQAYQIYVQGILG